MSVISIVVTDVIGDRPTFVKSDGKQLGRNKLLESQRFWRNNRVKETLSAILFDMAVTGDGFGWVGTPSVEDRFNAAKEATRRWVYKLDSSMYKELLLKTVQDEDLKKPKRFDYIPSSTVTINSNYYDVLGYTQRVGGLSHTFSPEEVIHFRYKTIDGQVEGFSPVEALTKELALLWFVNANMTAYLENGGTPDNLFVLENARPNDDHFEKFKEQLLLYQDIRNRHKSLLATSKVEVIELNKRERDMEYQNMALYITSCIALAYNIPVTRIPFLIGRSATSGDSGGMAEKAYWNMISERQDQVEDLMNSQVFEKLGFHMKLNRSYKQDEVRESQVSSMNADTAQKLESIFKSRKKRLSASYLTSFLNIPEEELEEIPEDEMLNPFEKTGLMNQNLLDNNSVQKEPDNRKRADTKRNVANQSINKGLSV